MRTASSNYNTYNALANKNVVFAMEFGSSNTKFVSDTFADYASPPMGVTYKKLVKNVRISVPELNFKEAHFTQSTFEVELDDLSSEFTSFLNSNNPYQSACVIKVGFKEINYADFLILTPSGTTFYDFQIASDFKTYTLRARDSFFGLVAKKIRYPNPGLWLSATLNAGVTASMSLVADPAASYGNQSDFANILDDRVFVAVWFLYNLSSSSREFIKYVTSNAAGNSLDTLTRGMGYTTDAQHDASSSIRIHQACGFNCDPLRAFLHLIMNTSAGTNGNYDLGINTTSDAVRFNLYPFASLMTAQVDVTTIERLGWKHFQEYEYDAEGILFYVPGNETDVTQFIEDYILAPNGFYFYQKDNKLAVGSLDVVDFIENFSAAVTFDSSNIEEVLGFDFTAWEDSKDERYFFYSQHNWDTKEFGDDGDTEYEMPGLTNALAEISQRQINAYGADLTTAARQAQQEKLNQLRRYLLAEISTLVRIRCKYNTAIYEQGDRVYLTLSQFPNISSGARGITQARALIVAQEFDLVNKSVIHTLRIFENPGYYKDQVTSYYSVNKIAEGSITDKTLSVSATETATTEAADAYYDNSGTQHRGDIIMFRLRITPPNFGGGSTNEIIALKFSFLNTTPAIVVADYRRYISFNPQSATAFEVDVYVANDDTTYPAGLNKPDRVKVDWISTTATGSEVPTVELIGVWFIVLNI